MFFSTWSFSPSDAWAYRPTLCANGGGSGVDSAWEQKKIEDRKMPENRTEFPPSTARFVRRIFPERACTKNLNVNLKQSLEYIDLGSDANSILNYLSGSLLAGI